MRNYGGETEFNYFSFYILISTFYISDEQCSPLQIERSGTSAGAPPFILAKPILHMPQAYFISEATSLGDLSPTSFCGYRPQLCLTKKSPAGLF